MPKFSDSTALLDMNSNGVLPTIRFGSFAGSIWVFHQNTLTPAVLMIVPANSPDMFRPIYND